MAVSRRGEMLPLGGLRQRAVLAALVIAADRTVDVDRLIEMVWDDAPPAKPIASLRAYVANLRRILTDGRLITDTNGYRLKLGSDRVDTREFDSQVAAGRRLLESGDPAGSSRTLERALGLWRGVPFADFRDQAFVSHEVHHLEALRADAVELRFEADLRLGRSADLVTDLESEIVHNPMRERLWAQLMLALYRSGRRTDSLHAYGRLQLVLDRELGVRPGLAIERLAVEIRTESGDLDWRPVHRGTSAGTSRGRRRAGLFGRSRELERLRAALMSASDGRGGIAVLSGDSGVGKTALASEIATIADDLGMATVWAGHAGGARKQPASAWTQVLRELAGQTDDLRKTGDDGASNEPEPHDGSDIAESTAAAVLKLAGRWPAVVVLDDLHRADRFTHDVLELLSTSVHRIPMLVLATWQDGGADRPVRTRAFDRLLSRSETVAMTLRGIDAEATANLIEHACGFAPTAELVAAVGGRTGGNPFYIRELTRLLHDSGRLDASTRQIDGADVPDAVSGIIRRRMADLPKATRTALTAAAVLGSEFMTARLGAALGRNGSDIASHLEAALEAGLIVELPNQPGYYRFNHGLVRDAVAAQLTGVARARMHADIARVYASEADQVTAQDMFGGADHAWRAGGEIEPEIASGLIDRALADAWARSAYHEIADLDRRALDICARLPADATRFERENDLLLQLAAVEAVVNGQTSAEVLEALGRASAIGPDAESASTASSTTAMAMRGIERCSSARYHEAAVIADALLGTYQKARDPLAGSAGYYIRAVVKFAHGHLDSCLESVATLQDEVLTPEIQCSGTLATFEVLSYGVAVWAHGARGDTDRARAQLLAGIAAGIERTEAFGSAAVRLAEIQQCAMTGSFDGLAPRAEEMFTELSQLRIEQFAPGARIIASWAAAMGPDGVDTVDDIRKAFDWHSEGGRRIFAPLYLALLSDVEAVHRSTDEARSTLHQAELLATTIGERVWDPQLSARKLKLREDSYRSGTAD
jgi:DNA-binding SARP family transcriptional activator